MCCTDLWEPRLRLEPDEDHSIVRRFQNRRSERYARRHGVRSVGTQFAEAHQEVELSRDTVVLGQTYYETSELWEFSAYVNSDAQH